MIDIFWETIKSFIQPNLRAEALKALDKVNQDVPLPGFGFAERGSRIIIDNLGKTYKLTPDQARIVINIASAYPNLCSFTQALEGTKNKKDSAGKAYLRVVLYKIGKTNPKIKKHIVNERWAGYRWQE